MKTQAYFLLLSFVMFAPTLQGQPTEVKQTNKIQVDENVFLHLDRSQYLAEESIELKAYFVQGFGNQKSNLSRTIYIELLDTSGEKLTLTKFKIERGFSRSKLELAKNYSSGTYFLRAYTNPILNQEKDFSSMKKIEIVENVNGVITLPKDY